MSLETHFNEVLELVLSSQANQSLSAEQLTHSIDLTLLEDQASINSLSKLKQDANRNEVAAICVFIKHLSEFTASNTINLATVINFPQGNEAINTSLAAIDEAARLGALEIDYVLPYRMYLDGNKQQVLNQCRTVARSCKQQRLTLKIILETGAFPDMRHIYEASKNLIELGCDFLKTSTGKIPQGASLSAVFAILSAIKDTESQLCGLKVSGGIKTTQQARNYAILAEIMLGKQINNHWFRIGASSLLDELLKTN